MSLASAPENHGFRGLLVFPAGVYRTVHPPGSSPPAAASQGADGVVPSLAAPAAPGQSVGAPSKVVHQQRPTGNVSRCGKPVRGGVRVADVEGWHYLVTRVRSGVWYGRRLTAFGSLGPQARGFCGSVQVVV